MDEFSCVFVYMTRAIPARMLFFIIFLVLEPSHNL